MIKVNKKLVKSVRRKRIWVNVARNFKEAEEFDKKYYAEMTPEERLSIVQELREMYPKFSKRGRKGQLNHENRRRLQRVVKIIQ